MTGPHVKLADMNPWEIGITWKDWQRLQARKEQDAKQPNGKR